MNMKLYIWRTYGKTCIAFADSVTTARDEVLTYEEHMTDEDIKHIKGKPDQIIKDEVYSEIFHTP